MQNPSFAPSFSISWQLSLQGQTVGANSSFCLFVSIKFFLFQEMGNHRHTRTNRRPDLQIPNKNPLPPEHAPTKPPTPLKFLDKLRHSSHNSPPDPSRVHREKRRPTAQEILRIGRPRLEPNASPAVSVWREVCYYYVRAQGKRRVSGGVAENLRWLSGEDRPFWFGCFLRTSAGEREEERRSKSG